MDKRYLSLLTLAALMVGSPAVAQVPSGAPSAPIAQQSLEQLVKDRLGQEALSGLACQASAATLQRQLEAAQARIKDLEARVPKDDPPK